MLLESAGEMFAALVVQLRVNSEAFLYHCGDFVNNIWLSQPKLWLLL